MRLPVVLNLEGPVVIIGAGEVGIRKIEYVLKFTNNIKVIDAGDVELPGGLELVQTTVTLENIPELVPAGTPLVIASLSDPTINRAIAKYCTDHGILVNLVDDPEPSTVLFSALSKSDDIMITISTAGKCPFLARKIREETDETLQYRQNWLEVLAPIREKLVGIDEKNRVLEQIYADAGVKSLVESADIEEAKKKAWEVCNNVCG